MTTKAGDQIPFSDPTTVVRTAYAALSAVQGETPGHQVAGVAVLLREMCDGLKLDLSEVLSSAHRIASANDTFFQREVKALRDYVQGELR